MEASCLELALEGERLCKAGDFKAGVAFFEAAVQVGTEDLKTLSAIYSQLGNAYFYLKEYAKALEYHKHDLTLARTIADRVGEAKASGNLGNTLKILGQFDEAVVCCQRHLDISQEQGDKVGEARALYNIGNVYHAKGKQLSWSLPQEPGRLPEEVQDSLERASEFYEKNLSLVKELGDRAAQGRAYGNLGNTHYLLANFSKAIIFHKQRLAIAKEFGDKAAERRAHSNLGNAHIFLGRFHISAEYYKKTLHLSRQLKDRAVEAQSCYSLGNTYTLLQDYEKAVEYHLKHLSIAQELGDRVGEGRACWSLENAYVSLGNREQALHFAEKHLEISQEIGDHRGQVTACANVAQLRSALGLKQNGDDIPETPAACTGYEVQGARPKRTQRNSMNSLELLSFPSEKDQNGESPPMGNLNITGNHFLSLPVRSKKYLKDQSVLERKLPESSESPLETSDVRVQVSQLKIKQAPSEECFFDLLSKFQSNRMDDQRCPLEEGQKGAEEDARTSEPVPTLGERVSQSSSMASPQTEELFDLIASSQSRRLDDQRASVGNLPGLRITHNNLSHLHMEGDMQEPGDEFFNMLMKCQSSRIDEQRCAPPDSVPHGPTVPDEDFFSLIQRVQAKRMNEQRVDLASAEEEEEEEKEEAAAEEPQPEAQQRPSFS
ncbi:G-protein-signaling modulator 1 isoform X2 [Rhineura floridana]|nr:G-protein-signaling modulator 1 isoform X2 [Rhineura floridana]XP_061459645.1 G-protein-signaling modulator 1 isoform X2 [Rhineura floridana]XP_061459646.1 G-protein-signaling modulator 1 isoform X2 [Rhineura floridana]XP_061459647.1 G-protein-signaling modulator 1 isoform X2 [Rhineura floridana]XP_061459648.1 G-protein-signaling modulator 1 isoform X2 [Rhineura floridana]XP_061459650.1 G-protein-signaling modulator 1 isoform X2 [Rhineura floridana]XP_061459651.1 G-protein-signaling modula